MFVSRVTIVRRATMGELSSSSTINLPATVYCYRCSWRWMSSSFKTSSKETIQLKLESSSLKNWKMLFQLGMIDFSYCCKPVHFFFVTHSRQL